MLPPNLVSKHGGFRRSVSPFLNRILPVGWIRSEWSELASRVEDFAPSTVERHNWRIILHINNAVCEDPSDGNVLFDTPGTEKEPKGNTHTRKCSCQSSKG